MAVGEFNKVISIQLEVIFFAPLALIRKELGNLLGRLCDWLAHGIADDHRYLRVMPR